MQNTIGIIGLFLTATGLYFAVAAALNFPPFSENSPPTIVEAFARRGGEQIEPIVPIGAGIFLDVVAVDPDGDPINYEWSAARGFFRTEGVSNPLDHLVFYEPPTAVGSYIVRVRVSDASHQEFDERIISVEVVAGPQSPVPVAVAAIVPEYTPTRTARPRVPTPTQAALSPPTRTEVVTPTPTFVTMTPTPVFGALVVSPTPDHPQSPSPTAIAEPTHTPVSLPTATPSATAGSPTASPTPMPSGGIPEPEPTKEVTGPYLAPVYPLDGYTLTTLDRVHELYFDWTATVPPYSFSLERGYEGNPVEVVNDLPSDSLEISVIGPDWEYVTYAWSVVDGNGNSFPPMTFHVELGSFIKFCYEAYPSSPPNWEVSDGSGSYELVTITWEEPSEIVPSGSEDFGPYNIELWNLHSNEVSVHVTADAETAAFTVEVLPGPYLVRIEPEFNSYDLLYENGDLFEICDFSNPWWSIVINPTFSPTPTPTQFPLPSIAPEL